MLLSEGVPRGTPVPSLRVVVFDPGITTGALRAMQEHNGAWVLDKTAAWDADQLMLRVHVWCRHATHAVIERLPQTIDPALGAIVKDLNAALIRMRVADVTRVGPGEWKVWIRRRGLPPSWQRIEKTLKTEHERDCLRMLCFWAARSSRLHRSLWGDRAEETVERV